MRSFTIILALAAALSGTACASRGAADLSAAHAELKSGMTEPQVVAKLGRPNARVSIGRRAMLMWVREVNSVFRPRARTFTAVFDEHGRMVEPPAETAGR